MLRKAFLKFSKLFKIFKPLIIAQPIDQKHQNLKTRLSVSSKKLYKTVDQTVDQTVGKFVGHADSLHGAVREPSTRFARWEGKTRASLTCPPLNATIHFATRSLEETVHTKSRAASPRPRFAQARSERVRYDD